MTKTKKTINEYVKLITEPKLVTFEASNSQDQNTGNSKVLHSVQSLRRNFFNDSFSFIDIYDIDTKKRVGYCLIVRYTYKLADVFLILQKKENEVCFYCCENVSFKEDTDSIIGEISRYLESTNSVWLKKWDSFYIWNLLYLKINWASLNVEVNQSIDIYNRQLVMFQSEFFENWDLALNNKLSRQLSIGWYWMNAWWGDWYETTIWTCNFKDWIFDLNTDFTRKEKRVLLNKDWLPSEALVDWLFIWDFKITDSNYSGSYYLFNKESRTTNRFYNGINVFDNKPIIERMYWTKSLWYRCILMEILDLKGNFIVFLEKDNKAYFSIVKVSHKSGFEKEEIYSSGEFYEEEWAYTNQTIPRETKAIGMVIEGENISDKGVSIFYKISPYSETKESFKNKEWVKFGHIGQIKPITLSNEQSDFLKLKINLSEYEENGTIQEPKIKRLFVIYYK